MQTVPMSGCECAGPDVLPYVWIVRWRTQLTFSQLCLHYILCVFAQALPSTSSNENPARDLI